MATRPVVVWFVGVAAALFGLAGAWLIMQGWLRYPQYIMVYPLAVAVIPITKIAILLTISVGLFERWRWTRWAAVLLVLAWAGVGYWQAVSASIHPVAEALGVDHHAMTYRTSRALLGFALSTGIACVGGLLVFQPSVKRYFGWPSGSIVPTNSPDPAQ